MRGAGRIYEDTEETLSVDDQFQNNQVLVSRQISPWSLLKEVGSYLAQKAPISPLSQRLLNLNEIGLSNLYSID